MNISFYLILNILVILGKLSVMQLTLQTIKDLPWGKIISVYFSVFIAFFLYYKSLREKKPYYRCQTFPLVGNNLSKLKNIEIKYNSRNITKLSMTKFAFWNGGKEPIRKEDIISKEPLVIHSSNKNVIYDVEIIYSKSANNFLAELVNDHAIGLTFDFLNCNDGATLNIFHNGSWNGDLIISGNFIGANKLQYGSNNDFFQNIVEKLRNIFFDFSKRKTKKGRIFFLIMIIPTGLFLSLILIVIKIILYPFTVIHNLTYSIPKEFY